MTPISPQKISSRGFTLLEILLVLTIFAAFAAIGLPRLTNRSDDIKKVARQMTALTKEIRNRAKLKNRTLRLVIDMTAEPHKYWVESSEGSKPIPANLYEQGRKEDENTTPEFQKDEFLTKKERELPGRLVFGAVETVNTKAPIREGVAYIHFFPEGFAEAAVIQITNRDNLTWTLVLSPLTGQAEVIPEGKFLKDLNQ